MLWKLPSETNGARALQIEIQWEFEWRVAGWICKSEWQRFLFFKFGVAWQAQILSRSDLFLAVNVKASMARAGNPEVVASDVWSLCRVDCNQVVVCATESARR